MGTKALAQVMIDEPGLFGRLSDLTRNTSPLPWTLATEFFVLLLGLAALGICAGRFVNINRFSLHGMYRNRLVRRTWVPPTFTR